MTKLRNLIVLAVLALFGSCDKGDDPVAELPCLLTSQVFGKISYTFTYDGQVLTTLTYTDGSSTVVSKFEYDGDRLTKLLSGDNSHVFTYTGDNITLREIYTGSKLVDKTEYEYSGNNLVKIQEYANIGTGLQKHDYRTFDYASNSENMIQERRYSGTSTTPSTVVNYSVYGVNQAAIAATPAAVLKYFKLGGQPVGLNIVKTTSTNGDEINYTYEFNEKGYPTKMTASNLKGNVDVLTYTYDCN